MSVTEAESVWGEHFCTMRQRRTSCPPVETGVSMWVPEIEEDPLLLPLNYSEKLMT